MEKNESPQEIRNKLKALREQEKLFIENKDYGRATHTKIVADFLEEWLL